MSAKPVVMIPAMVAWFWIAFVVTLALFGGALWSGLRRRRRLHFVLAPIAIAGLVVTIILTEQLVRAVEFPAEPMRIHLWFAKTAALLVLPVIATGLWTWRSPGRRRMHRLTVFTFLLFVVVATCTGIWVYSLSTPK